MGDNFLDDCSCFRVNRLSRRLTRMYDRALAATGLTVSQFALLAILKESGSHSLKELGSRTDTDPTTLTRNLKLLSDRGLVETGWQKEDRRVRTVIVTPAGAEALDAAIPAWRQLQAEVGRMLGVVGERALHGAVDGALARIPT